MPAELTRGLDEIVREGARRMLVAALGAEVDGYVSAFVDQLDEGGHRVMRGNGHAEARTVTSAAGGIETAAPRVDDLRVDDETGERCRFPPGHRAAVVPQEPQGHRGAALMYLHGNRQH